MLEQAAESGARELTMGDLESENFIDIDYSMIKKQPVAENQEVDMINFESVRNEVNQTILPVPQRPQVPDR